MEQIINETVEALRQGKTILYPTDTIWGIGCDARNAKA
ncbi:MAG: Sua5/YciO/YrdC/YwlC family protein, partial [Bacteroidaceae bacterium]|nr:Sua5/YciO/YrdC/YwlC family protein [Bacteroidaceae bacterium]